MINTCWQATTRDVISQNELTTATREVTNIFALKYIASKLPPPKSEHLPMPIDVADELSIKLMIGQNFHSIQHIAITFATTGQRNTFWHGTGLVKRRFATILPVANNEETFRRDYPQLSLMFEQSHTLHLPHYIFRYSQCVYVKGLPTTYIGYQ